EPNPTLGRPPVPSTPTFDGPRPNPKNSSHLSQRSGESGERSGVQRRSRGPELTVKRTTVAPRRAAKLPFGATPARRAKHRARLRPLQRLVIPPLELMLERKGLCGSPARRVGVSTRNVWKERGS